MCQDCGCTQTDTVHIHPPQAAPFSFSLQAQDRNQDHHHSDHHHADHHAVSHIHNHIHIAPDRTHITLEKGLLSKNDRYAAANRAYFQAQELTVFNLLSSPGSGKTQLLQRTISDLSDRYRIGVVVGDLETENDAQRLRQSGAPAVQILTGSLCHLEADMVMKAAQELDLAALDILVIENVGNLVCPAAFDLGENLRIALLSVTEGEDKPLKYPTLFQSIDIAIITKMDLAEAVGFNHQQAIANLRKMAPQAQIVSVSARTGEGMDQWYDLLSSIPTKGLNTPAIAC